jgi:predicted nucleotidyltransferase
MKTKHIVEQLLQEQNQSNATILEIFLTGSTFFKADDPTDIDIVAVCKDYDLLYKRTHIERDGKKLDLLIIDIEQVYKFLTFQTEDPDDRRLLFNYLFLIKETLYGDAKIEWNMFNYKIPYMQFAKRYYEKTIYRSKNKHKFAKAFVHYYLIYKLYYADCNLTITEEMYDMLHILYGKDEQKIKD